MPTLVMVYSLSTGWSILKQFNIKHVLGGKYLLILLPTLFRLEEER